MTTAVVYIQRCMMILAIFLCYFHVQGEMVDCELYPFHQTCRGSMSRKRALFPALYALGCDGSKGNVNCISEYERHRIPYIPLQKSKLLMSLLDNDMQKEAIYTARHRQRNNEMDERRPPLMENFFSELEPADTNY